MKIQPTTSNTAPSKSKKTKQSSTDFNALLSAHVDEQHAVQPTEQRATRDESTQQQPDIEHTLHTLEHALLQLESGSETQQVAQDAITELRLALRNNPSFGKMSAQELQDADTMLAVEAKRIASLNKV